MERALSNSSRFHMSDKAKGIIVDVIVYLFLLMFVYTAYSKFTTMKGFIKVLSLSPLTGNYSAVIGWGIPLIEAILSILLIIPFTKKIGLLTSLFLMISFTVFLIYGVLSGINLPCHCGGVISYMSWEQHIWFNISFIILAIIALKLYKKE
jgi:hypothetical protein